MRRWRGRICASVDIEAERVLDLVEAFDVLGFTTQVDRSGGRWHMELRRGQAPDAALLREVASVLERACTVRRGAEVVVETGGRSFRLPLRAARG